MYRVTIGMDVVENAKQDLIDKIKSNVDLDRVREICADIHNINDVDDIEFKNGDIVVYKGQVAYKLDYEVCFTLPVLLDEKGNTVSMEQFDKMNSLEKVKTPAEVRLEEVGSDAEQIAQEL